MADFEGNPFADPDGINPFADPSITQVTEPQPTTEEEYNPFAEDNKVKDPEPPRLPPPPTRAEIKARAKEKDKSKGKKKPSAQWPPASDTSSPAIIHPDEDRPPDYSAAPSAFTDPRTDEIRRKEEEIARREAALHERESNLERLGPRERVSNFPPFPSWCPSPLKPCMYLNIRVEIAPTEQWKMYTLLGLMIYTWILLIINVFVAMYGAIVIDGDMRGTYLTTFGVSILYLVLFVPGTFFCWFIPAYHAYRKDSSLAFMWFFFVMLFQGLSYILNSIGVPNLGACGFFNGAQFFNNDGDEAMEAGGAMFIIMGFLWFLGVPVVIILVVLIHRYYRSSGGTLNRATEEAMSGAARNKYVQGAVKTGVKAGVDASVSAAAATATAQ